MNVYCLFEQSGTFKKQFTDKGYECLDIDKENRFNQTDIICDIFDDILNAYVGFDESIFDNITFNDLVIAFFPCTRFSEQSMLQYRGDSYGFKNWSIEKKLRNNIRLHSELNIYYSEISVLCLIALRKGFKLIIENPYSKNHYLTKYWCLKPSVIHMDRRIYGDYYKKPTQFFFINCEPQNNDIPAPEYHGVGGYQPMINITSSFYQNGASNKQIARSMIHPDYAKYFIERYVLDSDNIM